MKKKILSILLAVLMVISFAPVSVIADEWDKDEIVVDSIAYFIEDGEAIVYYGEDPEIEELTIPETVEGFPVTEIYAGAFYGYNYLEKINLPDTIEKIGSSAFDSTAYFYNEDNWEGGVLYLDNFVICFNDDFKECTVKEGVTVISERVLDYVFEIEVINLPKTIERIDDYAFSACMSVKEFNVDENNENYSSEDGVIFNKDKTVLIQYPCGAERSEYVVPDGVVEIGVCAFEMDENLTSVVFPESLVSIQTEAFESNSWIEEFNIPKNVEYIGEDAFFNSYELKAFNVDSENKYFSNDENGVLFNKDKTKLLVYPSVNEAEEYNIPESVTVINECAFSYCYNLKKVTFPDGLTEIGDYAFWICDALTEIELPDSVVTVSDFAFESCSSLETVKLSENLAYIGNSAFEFCENIKSITIPGNDTVIGDFAFCSCKSLEEVNISYGVTSVGLCAFYMCEKLKSLTIPSSVTAIDDYAVGYTYDEDYMDIVVDDFIIYGKSGSTAEDYADINGITFVETVLDEQTTEETPTADEPATEEESEISNSDVLIPKDDVNVLVNEESKTVTAVLDTSAAALADMFKNGDFEILDSNKNPLPDDELVGTGCIIRIGSTEYTVLIPCDVDGSGTVTAADARLALRCGAQLENLEGVYSFAADFDGNGTVNAADARLLLRKSAGLEDL